MRYIKTNFNCMAKLSEQMEYQHEASSACTWCTPMYRHNTWMNEWMNEWLTTPQHEKQIGYLVSDKW